MACNQIRGQGPRAAAGQRSLSLSHRSFQPGGLGISGRGRAGRAIGLQLGSQLAPVARVLYYSKSFRGSYGRNQHAIAHRWLPYFAAHGHGPLALGKVCCSRRDVVGLLPSACYPETVSQNSSPAKIRGPQEAGAPQSLLQRHRGRAAASQRDPDGIRLMGSTPAPRSARCRS